MPRSKPRIWWCIKTPTGHLCRFTVGNTRASTWAQYLLDSEIDAAFWRRRGYRAVKIRVEEVDAE